MKRFKAFILENENAKSYKTSLKSYIKKFVLSNNIKVVDDSKKPEVNIKFPLNGTYEDYVKFFKQMHLSISENTVLPRLSGKYTSYIVTSVIPIDNIPVGTSIYWVNSGQSNKSNEKILFANKDLSPAKLNLAGKTFDKDSLIKATITELKQKYEPDIVNQMIELVNAANSTSLDIPVTTTFSSKYLTIISADFGEILAAIWVMRNLNFKSVIFPSASNAPLVDFYGIRLGVNYPISVKSGGGGKVSISHLQNVIYKRQKTSSLDISQEIAYPIFNIVSSYKVKESIIELHKFYKTNAIKKLCDIMGISMSQLTLAEIKKWTDEKTNSELSTLLEPFWNVLRTNLNDATKNSSDKLKMIVSPLGEFIWKMFNGIPEIKQSLVNIAQKINMLQINVDVTSKSLKFKSNYFKNSDFEFGWAGYMGGNSLGFKMNTIKK